MKKNIFILAVLFKLFTHTPTSALSVVYNFRIAQITRQPIGAKPEEKPSSVSPLLFDLYQKMQGFNVRENYAGGLITYNRDFISKNYFRADFAIGHINQTTNNVTNVDVIEPDDILLTMGHSFQLSQKARATVSVLFGFPTHAIYSLQRVGLGYGQVGLGAQFDGVYKFCKSADFLWGTRFNHFIPQTAFDSSGNSYNFTIGSIADVLVALQSNSLGPHGLEGGYDARWGFSVTSTPYIANLYLLNYMRNNFYLVYKYSFATKRVAHRFLFNVSYGFDTKPKCYGYNAVMVWTSWGIAF